MFKLLRYFSIVSFVAMSIVVLLLGFLFREVSERQVIEVGESKNVELAKVFSNSLRTLYLPLLTSELNAENLQDHPKIVELHRIVQEKMKGLSVVKIKIYNKRGLIVFSSDPEQIGDDKSSNPGFVSALEGQVVSVLTYRGQIYAPEGLIFERDLLSSYTPILRDGSIEGVFELYTDVTPLLERVKKIQIVLMVGVTFILALLYICLFFIVRYAARLLGEEAEHRRKGEKALANLAIRDSLTGLYNRRHFEEVFREEIVCAVRDEAILALFLCGMNSFKEINDTYGHETGDLALKEVSEVLLNSIRGSDLVFRWAGDEFMVVLPNTTREGISVVGERIHAGLSQISKARDLELDLSIGVAICPEHGSQAADLVRLADRALFIAKKGGDHFHIGEDEYQLDEECIDVVFQAVMDVSVNRIQGYEALSRDPSGKRSILQVFKKYGAIGKLHELKCLCFFKQLRMARELGMKRLFINVDFKILKNLDIPDKSPEMEVVLEISEADVLEDVDDCLEITKRWKRAGYKFAIDDFGAGFISLPFISGLSPDYIKLDRSTVLQAVSSKKFRLVLEDLVCGLRKITQDGIIAEGIETEEELSVMEELGITLIQGYLFGRPESLTSLPN